MESLKLAHLSVPMNAMLYLLRASPLVRVSQTKKLKHKVEIHRNSVNEVSMCPTPRTRFREQVL